MNPFPRKNSVIIMDNAKIHHDEVLIESIEEIGGKVIYLPSYSPDFNPIETAFHHLKLSLKDIGILLRFVMILNILFYMHYLKLLVIWQEIILQNQFIIINKI